MQLAMSDGQKHQSVGLVRTAQWVFWRNDFIFIHLRFHESFSSCLLLPQLEILMNNLMKKLEHKYGYTPS